MKAPPTRGAGVVRVMVLTLVATMAIGWSSAAMAANDPPAWSEPGAAVAQEGPPLVEDEKDESLQITLAVLVLVGLTAIGIGVGVYGLREQ